MAKARPKPLPTPAAGPDPAAAATGPRPGPDNTPITDLIKQLGAENVRVIARMMNDAERLRVRAELAEPFAVESVKFKPQAVKNNRCMAIAYIDARLVEDRLDEVVGVDGWKDDYTFLPDGNVMCLLSVRFGEEWVQKCDVGGPSDQPDGGDRLKAAFSDALKRAAVKFGIGRYLYRIPNVWVDYDPQRKQIVTRPQLPAFAVPKRKVEPKVYDDPEPEPPGVPPPPPPPVQPKSKSGLTTEQQAVVTEKVTWALNEVRLVGGLDDLNNLIRSKPFKAVPDFAKRPVFEAIKQEVSAVWEYDTEAMEFVPATGDDY